LTDFGADESFAAAARKVSEHYGIEIPVSGRAPADLGSRQAISGVHPEPLPKPVKTLITQTDGCLLPMVTSGD
jgi:hypothetical protein